MAPPLTVTAIVAAFNEEDVIGPVLADLVDQGIRVYLIDQGSTDGTLAEAERAGGRGLVGVEQLASEDFSLARIIRRKEVLAAELDSDWLINADADEFRESPWPGVSFFEGIQQVDRMGWNAIDFEVLNFPPIDDSYRKGADPREVFRFCERASFVDRLQVRCWKKQPGPLDLVSSAGHEARFTGRRVFPLRFLLRHYPIRSQAHGERKIFRERRPRYATDERARGWHVQYDGIPEGASFLREPSSLTPYDPWTARVDLALRHRGVEDLEGELQAAREATEEARKAHEQAQQAREAELAALSRERTELVRQVERLHGELREQRLEFAVVRQDLAAGTAAAERRARALQGRLDAILASRVWRWTGPVRWLLDRLDSR